MLIKKIISKIYSLFIFLYKVTKLRIKLVPIDRKLPFKGKIASNGYSQFHISESTIKSLRILKKNKLDKSNRIFLSINEKDALNEIFTLVTPEIRNYLGKESFLDGINWMETDAIKSHSKLKQSNSISWHTDNVGSRLKLFLCIKGDGTQPTLILPDKNRVPNFTRWLFITFMESFRRLGIRNKINITNSIEIKHYTGTANIFDTQLLHRGKYEKSLVKRIILCLEFSNPNKHTISRGAIGTKANFNSFALDENLLKIKSFRTILDPDRIHQGSESLLYISNSKD
tara:strand:- start:10112 stop:10966 length:855 start_codon:yes stop_codon:yes gene_type:complete